MRHKKWVVLLVLAAVAVLATVALVPRGPGQSTALEPSPSSTMAPPAWLLKDMTRLARNCGDIDASAWWTLTTAGRAAVVEGGDIDELSRNIDRPVFVYVLHSDFTRWLWSLPAGASAPEYRWVFVVVEAKSRIADVVGSSAKPFDTSGLGMQPVVLGAAPSPQATLTAPNVTGDVLLRLPDGVRPGSGLSSRLTPCVGASEW